MDRSELAQTSGTPGAIARAVAEHSDAVVELARARTELLARAGFAVAPGAGDLPTAFTATVGEGPVTVAICAEYDALPTIGHGCGHNLIAGAAVAAALGLQPVAAALGIQVTVVGTDRKSTRLNSSHVAISYAVFCLKKKKTPNTYTPSATRGPWTDAAEI